MTFNLKYFFADKGITLGMAGDNQILETRHYFIVENCRSMTMETRGKWIYTRKSRYEYGTKIFEEWQKFCEHHNLEWIWHGVTWHGVYSDPEWLEALVPTMTVNEAKWFLEDLLKRFLIYPGITAVDIGNEVFGPGIIRPSVWARVMGETFLQFLGTKVKQIAPNIVRYYNGIFDNEFEWEKALSLVYQDAIDGISWQAHLGPGKDVKEWIKFQEPYVSRLRTLGGKLRISELDYSSKFPLGVAFELAQAEAFKDISKFVIDNKDICDRLTFWGTYPPNWRKNGLAFNDEGVIKPSVIKAIETLK